jgi:hypothetical protein
MVCGETDTFKEIGFICGTISTVCDGHGVSFPQFASKCNTGGMKDLGSDRSWASNRVVFVIAPVEHDLALFGAASFAIVTIIVLCCRLLDLQVGAEHLVGRHADGKHNAKVTVVG